VKVIAIVTNRFPVGFLLMARRTERLKIFQQIRAAIGLRQNVINVRPLAMNYMAA
jgi:hypothetical protein